MILSYLELEERRKRFLTFIRGTIGAPYRWAAQGPYMYDCSGLVVAGLHHVDLLPPDVDMTSAQLNSHFSELGHPAHDRIDAPGLLCFYGNGPNAVHHVMIALTTWDAEKGMSVLVGARGGDPSTTTIGEAYRKGAMVCVAHGEYWRSHLQAVRDPFYFKGLEE